MKFDDVFEKYSEKNISINTWTEDDIFFIEGDSETLMFLSELIKAQAEEKDDDNFCIGLTVSGKKFFSKKSKFGILVHNTDSKC